MSARLGILVSGKGRGSNMANLIEACQDGRLPAEVGLVVAPREDTPAAERARAMGIPVISLSPKSEGFATALSATLHAYNITHVCLAGFMSMVPPNVLASYPDRIFNVHPALLPKFGGKGMYGMHVHEAVMAAGERESGCTVHLVNEHYDEGRILLQLRCPVDPDDTPETLAAKVLELEHQAYVQALQAQLSG